MSRDIYEHRNEMGDGIEFEVVRGDDSVGGIWDGLRDWVMDGMLRVVFWVAGDSVNGKRVRYLIGSYFDTFRKEGKDV